LWSRWTMCSNTPTLPLQIEDRCCLKDALACKPFEINNKRFQVMGEKKFKNALALSALEV